MANEIQVDLKLETKKAKNEIKGFANSVKNSLGSAAFTKSVAFGNLLADSMKSLAKVTVNSIGTMVNKASEMEDIRTQFATLTGSASDAKIILEELSTFAASTPFQLPGIAKAAKGLLAFGFSQDQLIPKLQQLGDVASASGGSLQEIGLIFGQVAAAGKLTGERLLQLQERAIPIGPALAKTMGVAESAVKDLVSKGKVDFKTFEAAFASLSKEGSFAFEGMIKQSKTFSGVMSTLGDNLSLTAAAIGQEFLPILKELAAGMIRFIQENKQGIQDFSRSFIDVLLPTVIAFADGFQIVFNGIRTTLQAALIGFKQLAQGVAFFTDALGITSGESERLEEQMNSLAESIVEGSEATDERSEKLRELQYEMQQVVETSRQSADADVERTNTAKKNAKDRTDAEKKSIGLMASFEKDFQKKYADFQKNKVAAAGVALGQISTLQQSENSKLFRIGQAGAVAQAIINTAQGITAAFALGPILGPILAPVVAAAGAVQIGMITSQSPPSSARDGIDFIPEDKMTFLSSRGERVVGARLNEDLTRFLGSQGEAAGSATSQNIFNINVTGQIGDSDETSLAIANAVTSAFENLNVSRGASVA